jgi:hypothetical protein
VSWLTTAIAKGGEDNEIKYFGEEKTTKVSAFQSFVLEFEGKWQPPFFADALFRHVGSHRLLSVAYAFIADVIGNATNPLGSRRDLDHLVVNTTGTEMFKCPKSFGFLTRL